MELGIMALRAVSQGGSPLKMMATGEWDATRELPREGSEQTAESV